MGVPARKRLIQGAGISGPGNQGKGAPSPVGLGLFQHHLPPPWSPGTSNHRPPKGSSLPPTEPAAKVGTVYVCVCVRTCARTRICPSTPLEMTLNTPRSLTLPEEGTGYGAGRARGDSELPPQKATLRHTHASCHGTSDTDTGSMRVSTHTCEHTYTSPPYMPGRPLAHHCFHHSKHPLRPSLRNCPTGNGAQEVRCHCPGAHPWQQRMGAGAVRNSERMPPTPLPKQAPPRPSHPQRLSPCAPPSARAKDSTQGLAWGQPGQGSCQNSGPRRGLCPAAQHPPLPPRPGWAGTKPAPEQPGNEGTPRRDVGAQSSLAPKRPSSGPEECLAPGLVRDSQPQETPILGGRRSGNTVQAGQVGGQLLLWGRQRTPGRW